jgi:curli production assembly/transport component CsgE
MRAICLLVILISMPRPDAAAADNNRSGMPAADSALTAKAGAAQSLAALDLFEGIVINQTLTRAGQHFYALFSARWYDLPLAARYTISIREQPSARFGSQIIVQFGQRRIFQTLISPNRSRPGLIETAVDTVYQAVTEGEMQRLLFKDPDLGLDEI